MPAMDCMYRAIMSGRGYRRSFTLSKPSVVLTALTQLTKLAAYRQTGPRGMNALSGSVSCKGVTGEGGGRGCRWHFRLVASHVWAYHNGARAQ